MPLLARTGGADDNVPPLHSRRLVRLVNEHAGSPTAATYAAAALCVKPAGGRVCTGL